MPVFLVDRNLPGAGEAELAAAQQAAIRTCRAFASEGTTVRYIRSTFLPEEARCMCLFEAPDAEAVKEVNEAAELPFERVVPALDLTPSS